MRMKLDFKNIIISPGGKTFAFFMSVILSGIICGWFTTEISSSGTFKWKLFYKFPSFYALITYLLIIYLYNRYIYKKGKEMLNFLDDDYCKAYIRSQCMPELIEQYKKSIRQGDLPEGLNDIHKEIKRLLK